MAFDYPIPNELDFALSRIMDYCMENEISGAEAQTMFEVGVGAFYNMQRHGITISTPNTSGENHPERPPSHQAA